MQHLAFLAATPLSASSPMRRPLRHTAMPFLPTAPASLRPQPPFPATQRVLPMDSPRATADPVAAPMASSTAVKEASAWSVHKFGGTSMKTPESISRVADILFSAIDTGASSDKFFVVVSAVGGITDRLLGIISAAASRDPNLHYQEELHAIADHHRSIAADLLPDDAREAFEASLNADVKDVSDLLRAVWIARFASPTVSDLIVGHGELWSAQLLWSLLRSRHALRCSWMDTRDTIVARQSEASAARKVFQAPHSQRLVDEWLKSNPTNLVVATGFICQDLNGVASTLGRNGSDYSAAIFANLLKAGKVEIWTDVNGVYSADPRIVNDAIVIPEISYKEAAELAYFGATVLHPDTMAPIIDRSIPMHIRNTFDPSAPGTWVRETDNVDYSQFDVKAGRDMAGVKGFTTVQDVSLINIEGTGMIGVPGIASRAFRALYENNVSVILIAQASSEFSICITVPSAQAELGLQATKRAFRPELADGLISSITTLPDCSILAMVGEQMQQRPGVSSRLFGSLTRAGVNIVAMAQGSSEHNISIVVRSNSEQRALRAAHAAFYLSDQTVSVGLIGPGVVGGVFLGQVKSQLEALQEKFAVEMRVRGIATSHKMLLGDPVDLETWKETLKGDEAQALDLDGFTDHIQDLAIPHAVIIDCTASEEVSKYYEEWLRRGVHIITPNKKANSGPMTYYKAMRSAMRRLNTHFFYEANVGAGLPIISSMRDLMRTGDMFLEVQGIFSGTLSYIFNEFDGSAPFSSVVKTAKDKGYTEPDPRDDLSGMDVARKVVILAREIGLEVELDDVPVKSLVPSALSGADVSVDEFMKRLPDYDNELTSMAEEAKQNGEMLRYVGVIDAKTGRCAVELRRYKQSHPFGRLEGSDNIVCFRTKRYDAQPLVIQGPGAGAEVTAAGVFADLLRLTGYLGAPSSE